MTHNNTVFAQLFKLVPRHEFERLAREHRSGRKARKLTRWSQFVAMGMAQLAGRSSLRDIVSNLSAQSRKLCHLGAGEVSRSSLSRVNADKPWELYRAGRRDIEVAWTLRLPKGIIVAADRAYLDFEWINSLIDLVIGRLKFDINSVVPL